MKTGHRYTEEQKQKKIAEIKALLDSGVSKAKAFDSVGVAFSTARAWFLKSTEGSKVIVHNVQVKNKYKKKQVVDTSGRFVVICNVENMLDVLGRLK